MYLVSEGALVLIVPFQHVLTFPPISDRLKLD
jgi:hypothetical protein